ncbi:hypothetical protein SPBR_03137 [Sporothrix brasiliensis 5110]|uniref:Protein kinase domain-containing protein n=1 Tax=Sporothrix brasiliensis 5110 TaxID=1398154 RepID=A0A0C2FQA8_9PEZI|nr:uncharacterized protein SPBR_03137 [Sporothrix brasiliensis 5110]KIH93223.1 hypothetical protein SPBR_03137 [Sporothrix brasiliensis 5110]
MGYDRRHRDSDQEEPLEYPRIVQVRDATHPSLATFLGRVLTRHKFRLGRSWIHADANLFHDLYPHVLRLTIRPRAWNGLVRRCAAWLPAPLQALVKRCWPGAFLPPRVVLKKLSRPTLCRTELFDNEIAMYKQLQAIQGRTIPRFYGEASFREDDGQQKRAIVLSVVEGEVADRQTMPISLDEFKRRLGAAHAEMLHQGVSYDDLQPNNLVVQNEGSSDQRGGRLVFLDLEFAEPCPPEKVERRAKSLISDYSSWYSSYLEFWETEDRSQLHREGKFSPIRSATRD